MATVYTDSEGYVVIVEKRGDTEYNPSNIKPAELRRDYTDLAGSLKTLRVKYPQYVRRLVSEDRLRAIKVVIKGSVKWFLLKSSLVAYRENSSRNNALRKYDLRFPAEYEVAVRKALAAIAKEKNFEITFGRAYKGKGK